MNVNLKKHVIQIKKCNNCKYQSECKKKTKYYLCKQDYIWNLVYVYVYEPSICMCL